MKKFYLFFIVLFSFIAAANCQVINNAEYFFDTDPGLGKGTSISLSPNDTISLKNIAINSVGLSNGYHYLYVRVKDSNRIWSHYRRQHFYVFNNSPILPVNDSALLAQAEYWIDSLPVPGTGKLVLLPAKDSIFYNDSIPGLKLDSGSHKVSVRIKDSKGNWSFIKTDSVRKEYYDLSVSGVTRPFSKLGAIEKSTITIKNRSSVPVYDLLIDIAPKYHSNAEIKFLPDSISNVFIKDIPIEFDYDSSIEIPIWIYSIPAYSEKSFDIYLTTGGAQITEDMNNSIGLLHDIQNDYNLTFRTNGDINYFQNSFLFNSISDALFESDSLYNGLNKTTVDSIMLQWFRNYVNESSIIPFSKYFSALIKSSLNSAISETEILSICSKAYKNFQDYYFDYEEDTSLISSSRYLGTQSVCTSLNCVFDHNTCPAVANAPLAETNRFRVVSDFCEHRCRIAANGDPGGGPHFGWDISPQGKGDFSNNKTWASGKDSCFDKYGVLQPCNNLWENGTFPVHAVYSGIVSDVCDGSCGSSCERSRKGNGCYIGIKSELCPKDSFTTYYLHFAHRPTFRKGDYISAGQIIGFVGGTGAANGRIHLHLGFKKGGIYNDPRCLLGEGDNSMYWIDSRRNRDDCNNKCKDCNGKEAYKECSYNYIKYCEKFKKLKSIDPNDKVGNEGFATQHYIKSNEQLHYGIFFENVDTATTAAQVVIIIDTLNLTKVDKHSFYLESITAGQMLVVLPDSERLQNLDSIYKQTPVNGTYVHIKATFDTITGVVKFVLSSLDTSTLQPVTGALDGLLPPDTTKFDGNGLVSYKVTPLSNIPGGTVITNTSHIVFDNNAPIATGTWFNTIDGAKPSSQVNVLPAITQSSNFTISWSGTDDGSGISAYDIYYKTSGDTAYTKWLDFTSLISAVFSGSVDSTYQFYSIAYDSVLNVEDAPSTADAFTKISFAKPIVLSSFAAYCNQNKVSIQWVAVTQPNINYFTIEKSADSINWISTGNSIQPYSDTSQTKYNFLDNYNGSDYYRLQVTTKDSTNSYSPIIKINCGSIVNAIKVYPIPAKNLLNILIESNQSAQLDMLLTDMSGRVIRRIKNDVQKGTNYFTLNTQALPSGQYILKTKSVLNLKSKKFTIIR